MPCGLLALGGTIRSSESCISSAATTALAESANTAISPSPRVLTTTPPEVETICAISDTLRVTTVVASVLPRVSYSAVLPRKSANKTVR